jgi:hypothetical protein
VISLSSLDADAGASSITIADTWTDFALLVDAYVKEVERESGEANASGGITRTRWSLCRA